MENIKNNTKLSELKKLNREFAYELMSVPTYSSFEMRLVTFVMLWAKKNNINFQTDDYGNVYLIKGELSEGEYYPCVTAHLDSVQSKHMPFIKEGVLLDIKETITKEGKTEWRGNGYGLGGDDKCGVLISLSMFQYCDKLKAAFFLEEEIGCKGSEHMDVSFFDNVGYVIGFDSPDVNRSAWSCSGNMLFTKDFYENHMKEICDKHNRTKFYSEPYTDVRTIRAKCDIMCMNFGSGYYSQHTDSEYVVLEDMDAAIELGVDLVNHLGCIKYEFEKNVSSYSYGGYKLNPDTGKYEESAPKYKVDIDFLKTLGDNRWSNYGGGKTYGGYSGGTYSLYGRRYWDDYDDEYDDYCFTKPKGGSSKTNTNLIQDEDVLTYVMDKYDEYIAQIKEQVQAKCQELNIDFEKNFSSIFDEEIAF